MSKYENLYNRLTPANRYILEERAAVFEYEGVFTRDQAEEMAIKWWYEEMEKKNNGK